MAQRLNKPKKTFQQRQTEKRQREEQRYDTLVGDMASSYTCAIELCRDFADQCALRIDDLEFDLACSKLALEFWSDAPEHAQPVVELLRQLNAERHRHEAALADLRERLDGLSRSKTIHHHLELPIRHYEELLRQRLFPDPPPAAGPELRGLR